jgi:hypothetical protein
VLLAAEHRAGVGVGSEEQEEGVGGGAVGAAEEAAGDEVDGGQLDAAVGGLHLGDFLVESLALKGVLSPPKPPNHQ